MFRRSLFFRYLPALLTVWVGIFLLLQLLPDASLALSGGKAESANLAALRAELGIDQPVHKQFFSFWRQLCTGELRGYYGKEPLRAVLAAKLAVSGQLFLAATVSLAVLALGWVLLLLYLRKLRWLVALLTGTASSVPLFITLPVILILCGYAAISPFIGGGVALALYPALLLATNLVDTSGHRAAPPPYVILAHQCGLRGWPRLAMRLRAASSAAQILLNSLAFFVLMGIPVAELMLGLPGAGRWMLESILRIDLPVIYLCAAFSALICAVIFYVSEIYSAWAGALVDEHA